MRTSLNNIARAEHFISENLPPDEMLIFSANLQLDPDLKKDVAWQQKTYSLIRLYGRKKLKAEIEIVHKRIFTNPEKVSYCQKIYHLFSKS